MSHPLQHGVDDEERRHGLQQAFLTVDTVNRGNHQGGDDEAWKPELASLSILNKRSFAPLLPDTNHSTVE